MSITSMRSCSRLYESQTHEQRRTAASTSIVHRGHFTLEAKAADCFDCFGLGANAVQGKASLHVAKSSSGSINYRITNILHIYWYVDRPLPDGTTKNRPSAVDFGRRRPIEGESAVSDRLREIGGRLREIKDRRKREEEEEKKQNLYRRHPRAVAAHGSPTRCCRQYPRAIFLPREEIECLPAWGERSVSSSGEKDRGDVVPFPDF
ncbi:hypothetical protein GW17_00016461 [Ensete ventricosum]|nr:hypothetical protein GW17_00016461 [Ensete ventricosum]